jgi:NitT/TauT family transport system permease protein
MYSWKAQLKPAIPPIVFLFLLVGFWQLVDVVFHLRTIIFPSPLEVGAAFFQYPKRLLFESSITMGEAVGGFALGTATAYLLSIAFVFSRLLRDAIYPYAIALKSTPLIAIAPLLVLWFGNGMLSKIVMSALVAFFPVLVNAAVGLTRVEQEALDLMRSLSATRLQTLRIIRIPNSIPYLLAGMKVASSLAVVGAIIGEFTGASRGIGYVINTSSYYLETPLMFASVISIAVGGVAFFALIAALEQRLACWSPEQQS